MRRTLAISLALWLLAGPASAQQVLVRTAEHSVFTRIVVDFSDRPEWRLGRVGDAYELRTDTDTINYDLSDVYRRIFAGRLVSIEPAGPGDLQIVTGCDCTLLAVERSNEGLIIDIRDGAPSEDDPYEVSLLDPPSPEDPRRLAPAITLPLTPNLTASEVLPIPTDTATRSEAAELGANLAQEIAEAAALDLVELAPGVRADDLVQAEPVENAAPPTTAVPEAAVETEAPEGPNIRIVTEAERAINERERPTSVDPSLCARLEKVLNPNDWVDEGVGPAGVDLDRRALFGLTGAADMRGFRDLVRGYLYLSFGREAAATLAAAPDGLVYRELYAALANIVEDAPPGNNSLAGMTSCPGHAGLWARLADPGAVAYKGDTTRPAAFNDWPTHLRRTLGPRLTEAYLAAGDKDSALSIYRSLARVADDDDPAYLMLAAALADEGDRDPAPPEARETVAAARSPESAEALITVIETRIAEDVPVGTDLAMQAGALAFEVEGTEAAGALRGAEVAGLIHDDLWRAAITRLEQAEGIADRSQLLSDLASAAADRANDTDVLWLAARLQGNDAVGRPSRLDLARRIADMGLSEMARAALDLGAAVPTADERRLLAQLALLEDQPGIAEAFLAGLDSDADQAMRDEIASIRARQDQTPEVPSAVPESDDEAAPGVEVARQIPPLPVVPSEGLETSRLLLGGSAELRNELEALLGSPVQR